MDRRLHIPKDKYSPLGVYHCKVPVSGLYRKPSRSSGMETELLYGESFEVHKISRGWAWGQMLSPITSATVPGYVGFVSRKELDDNQDLPTHIVTALSAPMFKKADIKSALVRTLPLNARVSGDRVGDFLQTSTGFIHKRHIRHLKDDPAVTDFVQVAESLLGRPYIWGGVSARGLDCSGLVYTALRAVGRDAPRDSDLQMKIGKAVAITSDFSNLKRGDLVFWKGHVGIMRSATQLLHANAYHMCVASEPLSTAVGRIADGGSKVTGIRRF